jgi:uncharacterized protein (TIGR02466 family)
MELFKLFPKIVGVSSLNLSEEEHEFLKSYISNIDIVSYMDKIELNDLNCHHFLDHPNLNFLKTKIIKEFLNYVNQGYEYSVNDFNITTSWLKVLTPGSYGHFHWHRNCMFSGVYYLEESEEKEGGKLVIHNSNTSSFYLKTSSGTNYEIFNITPKKNRIVFFPSEMQHKITRNDSNKNRYSIAFNFIPTGELGDMDSYLNWSKHV